MEVVTGPAGVHGPHAHVHVMEGFVHAAALVWVEQIVLVKTLKKKCVTLMTALFVSQITFMSLL